MINLDRFGFKKIDSIANRDFYSNGIFQIIVHNEEVYLDRMDGNFCSDVEFESDDDVMQYLSEMKEAIEKTIKVKTDKINKINQYL